MTSGHSNDKTAVAEEEKTSAPRIDWFEEAYASCPVASIVFNEERHVVFANPPARQLLVVDTGQCIDASESRCGDSTVVGLDTLVDRAFCDDVSLRAWQGRLDIPEPRPLEVRFIPLPGPDTLLLCQLHPYREIEGEVRVRLISQIADIHRRRGDLEASGRLLVATIHRHLEVSVAAVWCQGDEQFLRWSAGDEETCRAMANSLVKPFPNGSNSSAFLWGDELKTIRMPLTLKSDCSIQLLVAATDWLRASAPFWNCLATAAEASMQSARLLELHNQERLRLRAVLEHMPMAVLIFDHQGEVLELNLRARAMSGRRSWERIDTMDHPFEVCDHSGTPLPRTQWPMLRALRTGQGCEEEEFILDFGDKQRNISLTVVPITDDDDQITSFLATGRDVTQRSEEERRKDEFLSVASHELRSPLTPLSGFLHLSRKQAESDQLVDPDVLRRAETQVERLQRLIDGLLDMSRLETGKLPIRRQKVEMSSLLQRIMGPWLSGPHGDRISLELPNVSLTAEIDPDRIDQVITNVVDNAIKHGRPQGQVRVRLAEQGPHLAVIVEDDGYGMPQHIIDRVFDRYFCSHREESSGMGIGLYVSRQIVDDHGGTITIDSGPDQPTTVTVLLPHKAL